MHPLDNPTWHALSKIQSNIAKTAEFARRFPPELCMLGAFPDELAESPTEEAWASLASLGSEPVTLFSLQPLTVPAGWTTVRSVDLLEMVQPPTGLPFLEDVEIHFKKIVVLGPSDLPQMNALYEATRPGRKLCPRLFELGGFLGIKQVATLVSMACLRLSVDGYREISTVATLPGHTGKGYATALVGELAKRSRIKGRQAFLTVRTANARAYGIYKRLGFRSRVNLCSTTVRWESK